MDAFNDLQARRLPFFTTLADREVLQECMVQHPEQFADFVEAKPLNQEVCLLPHSLSLPVASVVFSVWPLPAANHRKTVKAEAEGKIFETMVCDQKVLYL